MSGVNLVMVEGNLTRDPEVRQGQKTAFCAFTLAHNHEKRNREQQNDEVSFYDVKAFGKLAERVGCLRKGDTVVVKGEIKQERWVDPQGNKRSALKIFCSWLQAFPREPVASHADDWSQAPPPHQPREDQPPLSDDDLPF